MSLLLGLMDSYKESGSEDEPRVRSLPAASRGSSAAGELDVVMGPLGDGGPQGYRLHCGAVVGGCRGRYPGHDCARIHRGGDEAGGCVLREHSRSPAKRLLIA
jgi:hypothetical protein